MKNRTSGDDADFLELARAARAMDEPTLKRTVAVVCSELAFKLGARIVLLRANETPDVEADPALAVCCFLAPYAKELADFADGLMEKESRIDLEISAPRALDEESPPT